MEPVDPTPPSQTPTPLIQLLQKIQNVQKGK